MTVDELEMFAVDDAPKPAVCFYVARGQGPAVKRNGMENVTVRNFRAASVIRRRDMRFVAMLSEPFEIRQVKRLDMLFYDRGDKTFREMTDAPSCFRNNGFRIRRDSGKIRCRDRLRLTF